MQKTNRNIKISLTQDMIDTFLGRCLIRTQLHARLFNHVGAHTSPT